MRSYVMLVSVMVILVTQVLVGCVAPPPQAPLSQATPPQITPLDTATAPVAETDPVAPASGSSAAGVPALDLAASMAITTVTVTWVDAVEQLRTTVEESQVLPISQFDFKTGLASFRREVDFRGKPKGRVQLALAHVVADEPTVPTAMQPITWVLFTAFDDVSGDAVWEQTRTERDPDGSVHSLAVKMYVDASNVVTYTAGTTASQSLAALVTATNSWSAKHDGTKLWVDFALMQVEDTTGNVRWVVYAFFMPPGGAPGPGDIKEIYCEEWLRCSETTDRWGQRICTWVGC